MSGPIPSVRPFIGPSVRNPLFFPKNDSPHICNVSLSVFHSQSVFQSPFSIYLPQTFCLTHSCSVFLFQTLFLNPSFWIFLSQSFCFNLPFEYLQNVGRIPSVRGLVFIFAFNLGLLLYHDFHGFSFVCPLCFLFRHRFPCSQFFSSSSLLLETAWFRLKRE